MAKLLSDNGAGDSLSNISCRGYRGHMRGSKEKYSRNYDVRLYLVDTEKDISLFE